MTSNTIAKYGTIILLLFFVAIVFLTLLNDVFAGSLFYTSQWKTTIFSLIDVTLGTTALIGIWKAKPWAYVGLIGLTAFGTILAILYPPTYISGGILNKMSNLPFSLYTGALCLILYLLANKKHPTAPPMNKKIIN